MINARTLDNVHYSVEQLADVGTLDKDTAKELRSLLEVAVNADRDQTAAELDNIDTENSVFTALSDEK